MLKMKLEGVHEGAIISQLCQKGDDWIHEAIAGVYKNTSKGIALPTSISVNSCACHFSPRPEYPEGTLALKNGDVVKV